MPATAMIHVRLDEETKAQATEALEAMGLSVSDAVRVFLRRVAVEKALPFALKVPTPETLEAMAEAEALVQASSARFATADDLFADLDKTAGS